MIYRERQQNGQVLLELLITLTIAVVILAIGAQLVFVTLQESQVSGRKNVATSLMEELFSGIDASTKAQWQNLFTVTKNANYHVVLTSGVWSFATSSEIITIDGIDYTRLFKVQNVCRNTSGVITGITDSTGTATGASACTSSTGSYDPSSELLIGQVSWPDNQTLTTQRYIARWPNKVCSQTAWSSAGSGTFSCPDTHYESQTNITTGATLQICNGGC